MGLEGALGEALVTRGFRAVRSAGRRAVGGRLWRNAAAVCAVLARTAMKAPAAVFFAKTRRETRAAPRAKARVCNSLARGSLL